jgi:rubrerythrin
MADIQYEVINYRQASDSTERNARAIAELAGGRKFGLSRPFSVTCRTCGHEWQAQPEEWGYLKECPVCGSPDVVS